MSKAKTKERVERMLIEADRINARNKRVLELFLYGNDKRTRIIAEIVGVTEMTVSKTIDDYYQGKIHFERENIKIYHSAINYLNENQKW